MPNTGWGTRSFNPNGRNSKSSYGDRMNRTTVDWKSGTVVYWDLDNIDEARPLCDQCEDLKEDLAQIVFPDNIVLDVGWYPSFDPNGEFIVFVVRDADWDEPLFRATAKDIPALRQTIDRGILIM